MPESRIYDTRAGRFIALPDLANAMANADVVFFGEQHDDPATHRAELSYLAELGARRSDVILSMEMFERDVQPNVDAYLAGTISDSAFQAMSRPWPRYTSDYRPLVEYARARGWRVVAANVPRRWPVSSAGRDWACSTRLRGRTAHSWRARYSVRTMPTTRGSPKR
jgi:uncharacterized iron-regulated protein